MATIARMVAPELEQCAVWQETFQIEARNKREELFRFSGLDNLR